MIITENMIREIVMIVTEIMIREIVMIFTWRARNSRAGREGRASREGRWLPGWPA